MPAGHYLQERAWGGAGTNSGVVRGSEDQSSKLLCLGGQDSRGSRWVSHVHVYVAGISTERQGKGERRVVRAELVFREEALLAAHWRVGMVYTL